MPDKDRRRIPLRQILDEFDAHRMRQDQPRTAAMSLYLTQEEAARRIAQNLHDEASQMLALAFLELSSIAQENPGETAEQIDRVIQHLDSVLEQIRGLSHELHPSQLERHGLVPALRKLAQGVSKRSGLMVELIGDAQGLPPPVELAIYRVAQEALSNVVRHADARTVEIHLRLAENRLLFSIADDGVGFRPALQQPMARYDSGLGLVGIYERIDSLGGECDILTGDREGMELQVRIPI